MSKYFSQERNKFETQLNIGQIYEELLMRELNIKDYSSVEGAFKPYDKMVEQEDHTEYPKGTKFEVKADGQVNKYGNLFIEFACNNVDSGYVTSKADILVYYAREFNKRIKGKEIFNDENPPRYTRRYDIPMSFLKEYIERNRHILPRARGGDGKRSEGYKICADVFRQFMHLQ